MKRRGRVRVAALTGVAVLGASAPATAGAAGPCSDRSTFDGLSYSYVLCGVHDLDQVRVASDGFGGLPWEGRSHCVPTATADFLAYLADRGFSNPPGKGNWTDPARWNDMVGHLGTLGSHMKTSSRGTTRSNWQSGLTKFLGANPATSKGFSAGEIVVKSFTAGAISEWELDPDTRQAYFPEPATAVHHATAGNLVIAVVGWYRDRGSTTTLDGKTLHNVLERDGGHAVALTSATATVGTGTARFGVHDPATDWTGDSVQSPYAAELWELTDVPLERRYWVEHEADGKIYRLVYEGRMPIVNGDDKARFDGFLVLEGKRVVTWTPKAIRVHAPVRLTPHQKAVRVLDPPGRQPIADVALAPESGQHVVVLRGARSVQRFDEVSGRFRAGGRAPAGAAHAVIAGARETVFVAGSKRVVALDRDGRTVGSRALAGRLDDLQFDERAQRLYALRAGGASIDVFDGSLRPRGRIRLQGRPSSGARATLAVRPDGQLLVSRADSTRLDVVARSAARAAGATPRTRVVRPGVRRLAVAPMEGALAVDDRGHMFTTSGGRVVELDRAGRRVRGSSFTGLPGGGGIRVSRSVGYGPAGLLLDEVPAHRAHAPSPSLRPAAPPPLAPPAPAPPVQSPQPDPGPVPEDPGRPDLVLGPSGSGRLTVRNQGTAPTGPFSVTVLNGRGTETLRFEDGLAAGATSDARSFSCPSGRTVTVLIDSLTEVAESDEDNNHGSIVCDD